MDKETMFFEKIKDVAETLEVNSKVRVLQDNNERIRGYWEIGKLIVEAQGGEARAKYGNELIKKWSIFLTKKYGKSYDYTNLARFRQFYLYFPKLASVRQLSWTHIKYILPIKDKNARNYYINQVIINNLSSRELAQEIKNKDFDRLSYADKENITLIEDSNYNLTIMDMIKDPILLKANKELTELNELVIHKYIIELLENKFLELGVGFTLAGHEYKINIDGKIYKIDLLFFNYELNCFVVVEVKTRELQPKDIGQLKFYINYIDRNIRKEFHKKTIGLLVVKKKNTYVIEYSTSNDLYLTTYKLV